MSTTVPLSSTRLLALKLALSLPIGVALVLPFTGSEAASGALRELQWLGPRWAAVAVLVFLVLVVLYARDLGAVLARVAPGARTAAPRRVWWMLVLPYNFIEDFFIIDDVARALQRQVSMTPALARFGGQGRASGWTWCVAQIVALLPGEPGAAAALVATVAWVWHWGFVRRALAMLPAG